MGYRDSSYSFGSGCAGFFLMIAIGIVVITLLGRGCSSIVSHINFDGDWNKRPEKKDNHIWGQNGIDPVLRTSTGAIYKDPASPDFYFDVTQWCLSCDGLGCEKCYNTGHPKVRIPSNGVLPARKKLPDDYYNHKGASRIQGR